MRELKITEFVDKLSSKEPTPGGGAAAAVTASMGVGAIMMAMNFSTNAKKLNEDQVQELEETLKDFEQSKQFFYDCIERDAKEFEPLSKAYAMPKETEEEQEARNQAIQEGLLIAMSTPLDMLDETVKVVNATEPIIPYIKKSIISDVGVGLQHLRAAILSSVLNIYINAGSLDDEAEKTRYIDETDQKLQATLDKVDALYGQVRDELRP